MADVTADAYNNVYGLTQDGVIFISIDDNEVINLRKLCDEIFGEENFVGNVIWERGKLCR